MPLLSSGASRFLGGAARGLAVPVPVLGAELLANGDFETGDPPTNWTAISSATLSAAADPRTGSSGLKSLAVINGAANYGYARQTISLAAGNWFLAAAWLRKVTGVGARLGFAGANVQQRDNTSPAWANVVAVGRVTGSFSVQAANIGNGLGDETHADDYSVRAITLASMFSARAYSTHATTRAACTVVAGTRAGVVANLDSASSPANFVIASHDGTTARLTKCVGGTYTELVSQAVAYVAGAYVEIRRLAGTDTWQLWYNGAQVGANQTISDAAIKAGTLHGMFNTFNQNQLSAFSCVAAA